MTSDGPFSSLLFFPTAVYCCSRVWSQPLDRLNQEGVRNELEAAKECRANLYDCTLYNGTAAKCCRAESTMKRSRNLAAFRKAIAPLKGAACLMNLTVVGMVNGTYALNGALSPTRRPGCHLLPLV